MKRDIFHKMINDKGPIGNWADETDGYYIFPQLEGKLSSRMMFKGNEVINWSINDYLGLSNHPEARKEEENIIKELGCSYPMGSRIMSGDTLYHKKLEKELADFVKKEDALVTNSGYQTMFSLVDALVNKNDVIVYDADSHACIIDGVRLHIGKHFTYLHNDMESLHKNLVRAKKITEKTGGGILVITEGVFGMQGEQGKLKEIVSLKDKFDFRLLVDDAHGFGTMGATGYGTGEEQGVQEDIDIYFATLGKSISCIGAFVSAKKEIIKYLKYNIRSQIFGRSLSLPYVVGALKRLELIKGSVKFKTRLWSNTKMLQQGLKNIGFDIGKTNTCVTPVYLKGNIPYALKLVKELREKHKVFCSMVVYPVIPKNMILLRLIPTATHTKEDIVDTLNAFSEIYTFSSNNLLNK